MKQDCTLNNKGKISFATVFTVAGVLYCLISLVNHYLFKTYTLDLGLYTHALYDYAHFRLSDCSMFRPEPQNILSDHFDLYLILLSPLIYIFGTYTLLIVQIAAVLLGGWGVYKLIGLYTDNDWLPILAMSTLFFSFGIIHPIAFDYHSNVLTAMMLPWLLYYLKQQRFGLATLFVALFVIGKENMSLWLFFIAIGLMWDYRKSKKTLWYLAGYAVFGLVYFFVINMVVMPRLGSFGGGFARYEYLGSNYTEIAKNLISHPVHALQILFTNTSGDPKYEGIKAEFYLCALTTGMIFTLLKPNYFLMLIPLIAQKMLAADPVFWGVSLQYSVEFMPVMVISSFLVIIKLKKQLLQLILACALLLSTILTTFYTVGVPKSVIFVDQICVYQSRHYEQSKFDADFARQLIKQIPDDASVSASLNFVPHLSKRREIYDFYAVGDLVAPDYVLTTAPYLDMTKRNHALFYYRDKYELQSTDGTLYLFKKKPS